MSDDLVAKQLAQEQCVEVKPLEWIENPDSSEGGWLGGSNSGIGPIYHVIHDGWSIHRGMFWHEAPSLEEAKAAAQADYEQRILSTITTHPAAEVKADGWIAAIEAAATVAQESVYATEDDGIAAWARDRIRAITPPADIAEAVAQMKGGAA